jgi:hypothetical protein
MATDKKLTPEERIAQLEQENAQLKQDAASGKLPVDIEALVAEKIEAGLTKDQAIAAARNQVAHDATNPHDAPPKAKGTK